MLLVAINSVATRTFVDVVVVASVVVICCCFVGAKHLLLLRVAFCLTRALEMLMRTSCWLVGRLVVLVVC